MSGSLQFERRAAFALLCMALVVALLNRPGHVVASSISTGPAFGLASSGPYPVVACEYSTPFWVPAAATTILIAGAGGDRVYVCAIVFTTAAVGTAQLVRGTGANCGTGTTAMTGTMATAWGQEFALGAGLGAVMRTGVGEDLCITLTGGGAWASGLLTFDVF